MERDELAAWLRLALTPGVGNITARKLLAAFGLPQAVFGQSVAALCQVATAAQAAELLRLPAELESQTERTWRWLHEASDGIGRHVATLGDDAYPASLLDIEDPPLLLYLTGRLPSATRKPAIAIVGSRNPTPAGKNPCAPVCATLHADRIHRGFRACAGHRRCRARGRAGRRCDR
jgi:DNA processing protein